MEKKESYWSLKYRQLKDQNHSPNSEYEEWADNFK